MRRILKTLGTGRYWYDELLPYWHEGTDYTWTKLDLQEGDNEIYVYYGSSTATDESNGDDVFEFFDDFEGTELDTTKWQEWAANISISSSVITCWDGDVNLYAKGTGEGGVVPTLQTWWLRYRGKSYSDYKRWGCIYSGTQVHTPDYTCFYEGSDDQWTSLLGTGEHSGLANNDVYNWYIMDLIFDGSEGRFYFNGTLRASRSMTGKTLTEVKLYSCRRYAYDWVLLCKYDIGEPTVSYGSEEAGSWTIDGHVFTKRKKVTITASQSVEGYQVRLSYSQWNDPNLRILHRVTKYIRGDF